MTLCSMNFQIGLDQLTISCVIICGIEAIPDGQSASQQGSSCCKDWGGGGGGGGIRFMTVTFTVVIISQLTRRA
jgi:hypothetical protein